jgi:hypothetical protein
MQFKSSIPLKGRLGIRGHVDFREIGVDFIVYVCARVSVCMCLYIYVHVHIHMCACVFVPVHVCICACKCVLYVHVSVYTSACICACLCACECMHVCTCLCACVCMYVCMCLWYLCMRMSEHVHVSDHVCLGYRFIFLLCESLFEPGTHLFGLPG